ncbi:hypothetical protein UFOVP232_28 [uncultured Caudovirales phage]|uniref:Uncharacterized protein n=1 Tax=uncultured Caudovirales phage TaxID=2100421 RepID=A0A6J7WV89_9CAUD|nr:hypothetical protein UFOVP232_28 [uncultured Caudovirales phage]
MTTTINGKTTTAKKFAFDGCHKIYLLEKAGDEADAIDTGYDIFPISELQSAYDGSCGLRFISDWSLTKSFVPQFEDAVFA